MPPHLFEKLEAVDLRHPEICEKNMGHFRFQVFQCLGSRARWCDLGPGRLQQLRHQRERVGVVINCKDMNATEIVDREFARNSSAATMDAFRFLPQRGGQSSAAISL